MTTTDDRPTEHVPAHFDEEPEMPKKLPTTTESTISLGLHEAIAATGSVLPHASKDDMTPIITNLQFAVEGETINLVGTDRYSVGTYLINTSLDSLLPAESFMIPRTAAEFVSKIAANSLRFKALAGDYIIRFTTEEEPEYKQHSTLVELVFKDKVETSKRFDTVKGNYPPVLRLLPMEGAETSAEYTLLSGNHLMKFITSAKFAGEREQPMNWEFFHGDNPNKPSPVRVTIGKFTGLLQPNLKLR